MSKNDRIIGNLEEVVSYVEGNDKAMRKTVIVPKRIDVKRIRAKLDMSQQEFALRFGVPVSTVRNWEQERRHPEGTARILLKVIEKNPKAVEAVLHEEAELNRMSFMPG